MTVTTSPLTVQFPIGSRESKNITSWSISSDWFKSTDDFSFDILDSDPGLKNLEGQPVVLSVNGAPQLFGRVDVTTRGGSGSVVSCQGRDYIADLVECNVDPTLAIKEGETLGAVVLKTCSPIGITKLASDSDFRSILNVRSGKAPQGRSKSSKNATLVTLQDLKPNVGQGIYEFLKPICDRHGCTIQPANSRDTLLIAGPNYSQELGFKLRRSRSDSGTNNVLNAVATRDYSSFPTLTVVQGQGAPRAGESTSSTQQNVDTWAQAQHYEGELARILSDITWTGRRKPGTKEELPIDKIYRLNMMRDEKSRSHDQIVETAKRLFSEHIRKTLDYTATVKGHIDPVTGAVWSINTLVQVDDDICDIHEYLWMTSRTLTYDPGAGALTKMSFIRPHAYDFEGALEQPKPPAPGQQSKKDNRPKTAKEAAAEQFVRDNFGEQAGPADLLEGLR